jgi:hypothetical protein
MTISENPDRDNALAILAQACDQLGLPNRPPPNVETLEPDAEPLPAKSRSVSRRPWLWGKPLLAAIGLTLMSVAAIAWISIQARSISSPAANSATEASARPALPGDIAAAIDKGRSQPSQKAAGETVLAAPLAVSKDADQQSLRDLTRALLDVRQEISQLKSSQIRLTHENAELAQRLKEVLETAQSNADRSQELKAIQTQLILGKDGLTEQLNASQAQMSGALAQLKSNQEQLENIAAQLKSTQDQIARLAEQKSRPKTIATVTQSLVSGAQRPPRPPPTSPQLKLPLRTSSGPSPR